jgi:hypothetical protein
MSLCEEMNTVDGHAEQQQYLQESGAHSLINELLVKLLHSMPEDPVAMLLHELQLISAPKITTTKAT